MHTRKPLIAGNWKMHKTVDEAASFVQELHASIGGYDQADVVVSPPAIAIDRVCQQVKADNSNIHVAAQNVHPAASGAFTGEHAVNMLQAAGCTYCIVGHSERRSIFKETDAFIREKVDALLAAGIKPIICIGETLEEREQGQTKERVETQLTAACKGLTTEQAAQITIAYEPVWAIGTGLTATPEQAQDIHAFIRELLGQLFSAEQSQQIRVLYGGSVKPANVKALMAETDIDGALVGGASLKVDSFTQLVKFAEID
jgi:triosephosphate isomerase